MRAAVVGLGVMGKLHARVYKELGSLVAVCDLDGAVAESVGRTCGVPGFSSLMAMLDYGVDAVSIAVPTLVHRRITEDCIGRGCHVLIEKPLAPTVEEAEAILSLQAANRIVAVGYIETYNPAFRAVKSIATHPGFGEITSVNIRRVGGLPRSADNVILDLMTHDIGLLMDLFGCAPDSVYVHRRGDAGNGIINSAQALFSFGQASASCEANWVSPIKIRQIVVTGTQGYCEADLIGQKVTKFVGGSNPQQWGVDQYSREPLKEELQAFLANARNPGTANMVDARRGLEILKVTLEACQ